MEGKRFLALRSEDASVSIRPSIVTETERINPEAQSQRYGTSACSRYGPFTFTGTSFLPTMGREVKNDQLLGRS
jgi:hypothetical protein